MTEKHLYIWLSPTRLIIPRPDGSLDPVMGPCVVEHEHANLHHRIRHPGFIPWERRSDLSNNILPEETLLAMETEVLNKYQDDPSKLPYRKLQRLAKSKGLNAAGTHEEILNRVLGND